MSMGEKLKSIKRRMERERKRARKRKKGGKTSRVLRVLIASTFASHLYP